MPLRIALTLATLITLAGFSLLLAVASMGN
jgi:hypothetical protein